MRFQKDPDTCGQSLSFKFNHGKNTRGNGSLLLLPKVRSESEQILSLFKERRFTTICQMMSEMKSTLSILKAK